MRVELVPGAMGTDTKCVFCGQWFLAGSLVGRVAVEDHEATARHAEAARLLADPDGHDNCVCPECLLGGGEAIRAHAAARARDLVQRALLQVRLVEAIRTEVFELPTLSMGEYCAILFHLSHSVMVGDDEDPAAAR